VIKIIDTKEEAFDPALWSCYVETDEALNLFKSTFDYLRDQHDWSFHSIAREAGSLMGRGRRPGNSISNFYNGRHKTLNFRYIAIMYRVTKDERVRKDIVSFLKHPQVEIRNRWSRREKKPKDEIINCMINLVVE